jgi:4-amino-4-deoxy-L-arabinose transferase-like glycosyltransferase
VNALERLGPPRSVLRRARLLLLLALALLLLWLVGPYAPWLLPGDPTLVPRSGQSRIHTVLVGLWWAAAANALICTGLLATSRLWARPGDHAGPGLPGPGARVWLLLLAAAALAGVLRWPLVQGSLWWDEAWSIRHTVVGQLEPAAEGQGVEFHPVPWLDTLWNYRAPTNHVAYSVASRLSHAVWRAASGAERQDFDEVALRLPAWLAALGSVVAIGLLVHALGFPLAAPAAAFLLAIHPWHIRYGADGRGYSFVVLFGLAAALMLLRALREDRWRYWLGFAGAQLLVLWTLPIAVYLPLCLTGAALAAIAWGPAARRGRLLRLVAANVLAAMAYLQLMTPNLAQAVLFERLLGEEARFEIAWLYRLFVFATTGLHVRMPELPDVAFPTLATLSPALRGLVCFVFPALLAAGLLRTLRRGGAPERAVALGLVAAPLLLVVHRAFDGFFAYQRFAIYSVIPAVALLVIGFEGALRALLRGPEARWALPAGLAAGLAAYQLALAPLTRILLENPQAPAREVAEFMARQETDHPLGAVKLGVGQGGQVPRVYDPFIVEVTRAEELVAALEQARAQARPLYAAYGYHAQNRRNYPDLMALLEDLALFEPVARFDGIESEHVYRVLRYTGAPPPAARDVRGRERRLSGGRASR